MTFHEKLLGYFHLTEAEFLSLSRNLTFADLPNPSHFTQMDKAVARIHLALQNKEKIMIYGDYDCDGVLATSILVKAFAKMGIAVGYYLPSRYLDGYGLNPLKVAEIAQKGYSLIITVDNGITATEALEKASLLGVDVIVTDHHEAVSGLPKAFAILHPVLASDEPTYSCGAYVAFMLSVALLQKVDDYLLSLAGIATVSDMMPLLGVNRDVLRLAMNAMNEHRYPQIAILAEGQDIDEKVIGMRLAPKINAVGRLVENANINRLVKYFTSEDITEINELASWMTGINEDRKALMKGSAQNHETDDTDSPAIVLLTEDKEGLIGLVANRLLMQFHKPVVVFTSDSNDPALLKGSARSQEGFNISKAFKSLESFMVKSGGHGMAGGLSIRRDDFAAFKKAFEDLASTYPIEAKIDHTLEIETQDITWENYQALRQFAPFGMSYPAPKFVLRNLDTKQLTFISSGRHLSTLLGNNAKLLGFNLAEKEVRAVPRVDLLGEFEVNVYRNQRSLVYKITSFSSTIA
ncbi:MAG: DHH family phosphoesterase [Firmicutes bacterium]|nr:DHH family phosphoesterase [Bacillota bacterium]